jgi:hypothetical protein
VDWLHGTRAASACCVMPVASVSEMMILGSMWIIITFVVGNVNTNYLNLYYNRVALNYFVCNNLLSAEQAATNGGNMNKPTKIIDAVPKRDALLLDGYMFGGIALDVHGIPDDGDGCKITAIYAAGDNTDLYELIDMMPRGIYSIEVACDMRAVKDQKASKFDSAICDLEYAK